MLKCSVVLGPKNNTKKKKLHKTSQSVILLSPSLPEAGADEGADKAAGVKKEGIWKGLARPVCGMTSFDRLAAYSR